MKKVVKKSNAKSKTKIKKVANKKAPKTVSKPKAKSKGVVKPTKKKVATKKPTPPKKKGYDKIDRFADDMAILGATLKGNFIKPPVKKEIEHKMKRRDVAVQLILAESDEPKKGNWMFKIGKLGKPYYYTERAHAQNDITASHTMLLANRNKVVVTMPELVARVGVHTTPQRENKAVLIAQPKKQWEEKPYVPNSEKVGFMVEEQFVPETPEQMSAAAKHVLAKGEVSYARAVDKMYKKAIKEKLSFEWDDPCLVFWVDKGKEFYLYFCLRFEEGAYILSDYDCIKEYYVADPNELDEIFDYLKTYNSVEGKGQLCFRDALVEA